ncbi:MAG: condensation domain-containing protein [Methylacidiphilales bacterium]|nr:condensation domain-containing protein [Candidatus Methylacidiphilales bacterium]
MTQNILESAQPRPKETLPSKEADVFVMPCSISQQRFWVLDQLYPGNTALNIPLGFEFRGPLNIPILERAFNAMVQRHEVLRTTFAQVEGAPKQIIKAEAALKLVLVDLTDVPAEKRPERIEQEMIAEAARPLSLTQAPILRTTLLCLAPEEHVLMLTIHHIIGDGWSNGLLIREVGRFYDALLHDKPVDLPPLAFQYADYAIWQQEWLKTPQFQKQMGYWRETLSGDLPVLDMPTDFTRQAGEPCTAFIESLLLPPQLGDALKRLSVDLDVTLFLVLFAAYVTLLYRYTGQTRFVIGTTAANRNRSEMEHLIGLFANPLILCPEVSGGMTFRELAVKLRDHSLDGFAHQEVPFEMILEELQEKKGGARKPAAQTHFLYQKAFMEPATYGDLAIRPLRSVSPGSTFELTYGIVERAEGIRLQMEYHTALYKNSTIRRLLRHFQRLLEAAVENPNTPVGDLPLLTDEERGKLEASLLPKESSRGGARPNIDPQSILQNWQDQLNKHFREAADPRARSIEPPPGAVIVVLDRHLCLLPAGVPGGLYLGGAFSEALPRNALVLGPLDSASPIPLLHTAFVGRYCEDGKIELLGQARDFAQINGFQINLRQVEAFLLQDPGVLEAAAVVFPKPSGENQLVGYVVPKLGASPVEKDLRAFLKGKISDFTLPSHIVTVPALPRDVRGELVVELLPEPLLPSKPVKDEKIPLEAILYQQLIEIWMDLLKAPSLTIEDNFFALGGTSLLALRMMTQIEKLCGRPLPLSLLLTGATIANLARYIVEANNESPRPMVTVQANGNRPPLFFLHGDWAGGGFYCGRLSKMLGEDQPFYALPPYRSGKPKVLTLEEMAAYHIAAIREHTPQGPYLLGGYCIGATVVMEIARQLAAQGEKVTHLLLIDPPQWVVPWLRWVWPLVDRAGDVLKWDLQKKIYYFDYYAVSFARWLRKSPRSKITTLCRRLGLTKSVGSSPITMGLEAGEGDGEILNSLDYAVYFLAYRLYNLKPLSVPATLYFPEETPPLRYSWVKRASKRSPEFAVVMVQGDHHTCVTKYTSALVDEMKKTLAGI